MNNTVKLCDYGCGQEAKYTFKNGKNCCSKSKNSCPVLRKKNGDGTRKPRRKKPDLCDYACGQEAKFYFKLSDKWCCSKSQNSCPSIRKKLSISATGYKQSEMRKTNHSLKMKELWKNPSSKLRSKERKEKLSRWMKNGHCLKMIKAIKKISNEEIKLRDMVKELYPDCEFQFPVLRYSLDVAIPKYKIAIRVILVVYSSSKLLLEAFKTLYPLSKYSFTSLSNLKFSVSTTVFNFLISNYLLIFFNRCIF